jgi:hypothetical protein
MPKKELRRLRSMAKELQVSNRTMYNFLREGVPFIKRGRIIWLDPQKVFAWLEGFEKCQILKQAKSAKRLNTEVAK